MDYQQVIQFWFEETTPQQWWQKDSKFDETIKHRFSKVHQQAMHGELAHWRKSPLGRLAEVIVLDQFSRNIFRDTALAFASDPTALILAQEAIANKADEQLTEQQRAFLYMPYMHSESKLIHQHAVTLFNSLDDKNNYQFELKHKEIIDRFGRYPHRNELLGRESTNEELEFLKQPGSSF